MSNVNKPNTFSSGTTISSSQVNANFDTIYNDYNGNVDATNLASGAVTTAKIADSNVTTAKIADSNVTTAKIADAAITNAKLDTTAGTLGGAWTTWTPTFTNLSKGNGVLTGRYTQVGKTVRGRFNLVFGTTTSVSGDIIFSLPATSVSYTGTADTPPLGVAHLYDVSATRGYPNTVVWASTTTAKIKVVTTDLTYAYWVNASSTVPFTFATGDEISVEISIEVP